MGSGDFSHEPGRRFAGSEGDEEGGVGNQSGAGVDFGGVDGEGAVT